MAGARSKLHKSTSTAPSAGTRRSARRGNASQNGAAVPDVFQDLLTEATSSRAAGPDEDSKPLKKRKTTVSTLQTDSEQLERKLPLSRSRPHPPPVPVSNPTESEDEGPGARQLQTIEDSDESDGPDDSDLEWEDALGDGNGEDGHDTEEDVELEVGDLSITIGGEKGKEKDTSKRIRRRGITSVDKKRRLEIHKMHVLCLLYHVHRRNAWCNDERVHATLRKLPSPKTLSNLIPNPEYTQYQASKRFIDGMNELKMMWTNRFTVTALGMHKPRWMDADAEAQAFSAFDELDMPMDRHDFRKAAVSLQGSQDVGAQLFCALLRGIGIEARLVCSLQCLPFASAAQSSTPQKPIPQKNTIHLDPYNRSEAPSPSKQKTPSRPKKLSRLERLIGERSPALSSGVAPKQRKKYHTAYPVYWVEALNPAHQKWVPIDSMSTFTVDKADKLEPSLNYSQNSLTYAVAFEDDLTAKDVTRRYAKAYNAKTRKFRVECTPGGNKWWRRALKLFRRTMTLDRDQVEDAALARKEAAEGMPKNVQDFKDHPIYVLERHLKYNEVIHPLHQVGKVNVSSSMNPKMEPIYRRKDVHVVRSADKWYRLGRDVKDGEQPLKHAKPKKGTRLSAPLDMDMDMDDQQEEIGAALYALFQTELYVPPPVVRGRVPRNAYGNLDIYVPSMIPPGGAHVRHKLASKAARIVGVDYADAVTGFAFKGRHGTAIVQGIIVAEEYKEAVETVLDAMEYSQEQAEISQRSAEALRMWRRFLLGLRIAQRVNAIEIDGETGPIVDVQEEIEREDKALAEEQLAGGFFMDESATTEHAAPTKRKYDGMLSDDHVVGGFDRDVYEEDGGFMREEAAQEGGFVPAGSAGFGSSLLAEQQIRPRQDADFGSGSISEGADEDAGGFIPEGVDENAGGFIRDPFPVAPSPPSRIAPPDGGIMQVDDVADHGGGFIPIDKSMTDISVDATYDRQRGQENTSGLTQDLDDTAISGAQNVTTDAPQDTIVPEINPSNEESAVEAVAEPSIPSSSPSEAGSLPLEDPEDEDADPDWLVDVT